MNFTLTINFNVIINMRKICLGLSNCRSFTIFQYLPHKFCLFSSALDTVTKKKVAIKKLARPFQSAVHAKRTFRELKLLKHMRHENVIGLLDVFYPKHDNSQVSLRPFSWRYYVGDLEYIFVKITLIKVLL